MALQFAQDDSSASDGTSKSRDSTPYIGPTIYTLHPSPIMILTFMKHARSRMSVRRHLCSCNLVRAGHDDCVTATKSATKQGPKAYVHKA